jgi:hypothetical protein
MKKIMAQIIRENRAFCMYASVATGVAFIQVILHGLQASPLTEEQIWIVMGAWILTVYMPLQLIVSTTKVRY